MEKYFIYKCLASFIKCSGLKSIVIPLLAGLMEPDASKMITYNGLFRMVQNIRQKIVIHVFHYSRCEDLKIYAEPNIT